MDDLYFFGFAIMLTAALLLTPEWLTEIWRALDRRRAPSINHIRRAGKMVLLLAILLPLSLSAATPTPLNFTGQAMTTGTVSLILLQGPQAATAQIEITPYFEIEVSVSTTDPDVDSYTIVFICGVNGTQTITQRVPRVQRQTYSTFRIWLAPSQVQSVKVYQNKGTAAFQ